MLSSPRSRRGLRGMLNSFGVPPAALAVGGHRPSERATAGELKLSKELEPITPGSNECTPNRPSKLTGKLTPTLVTPRSTVLL
jgi:hypothetical protein